MVIAISQQDKQGTPDHMAVPVKSWKTILTSHRSLGAEMQAVKTTVRGLNAWKGSIQKQQDSTCKGVESMEKKQDMILELLSKVVQNQEEEKKD